MTTQQVTPSITDEDIRAAFKSDRLAELAIYAKQLGWVVSHQKTGPVMLISQGHDGPSQFVQLPTNTKTVMDSKLRTWRSTVTRYGDRSKALALAAQEAAEEAVRKRKRPAPPPPTAPVERPAVLAGLEPAEQEKEDLRRLGHASQPRRRGAAFPAAASTPVKEGHTPSRPPTGRKQATVELPPERLITEEERTREAEQVAEDTGPPFICNDCDPPTEWDTKVARGRHQRTHTYERGLSSRQQAQEALRMIIELATSGLGGAYQSPEDARKLQQALGDERAAHALTKARLDAVEAELAKIRETITALRNL